tara:strand:- start:1384 stop:1578 length:195 start_codon:yes stop_codon:yes gene_type:complete
MHFCGPNAGEVTQGFGVAMKKRITFADLSETVGIHPTSAEVSERSERALMKTRNIYDPLQTKLN